MDVRGHAEGGTRTPFSRASGESRNSLEQRELGPVNRGDKNVTLGTGLGTPAPIFVREREHRTRRRGKNKPKPPKPLTPEKLERLRLVIFLYRSGCSSAEVALATGLSKQGVLFLLRRAGHARRDPSTNLRRAANGRYTGIGITAGTGK